VDRGVCHGTTKSNRADASDPFLNSLLEGDRQLVRGDSREGLKHRRQSLEHVGFLRRAVAAAQNGIHRRRGSCGAALIAALH
jgi:hypothetical protein